MRDYFTPAQIRDAEAPLLASLPDGTLMRRAAYGLATVVARELTARTGGVVGRTVVVLVGSGDNGGDGLWAGALLRRRGVRVVAVCATPDRVHRAGLEALRNAGGRIASEVPDADLVIDALVGLSGSGPLRPDAAALVEAVRAPIVAVDLPSGVDAETGAVTGPAVTAEVTVTFGGRKPVHALAAPYCGRVELVDIGLSLPEPDVRSLEPSEVGAAWPMPTSTDDKYSQGVVGVLAGSDTYPGAALLCVGGAVAATSGMVRYVGGAADRIVTRYPEVVAASDVASSGRVQAWVVGPGFGTGEESARIVREVLASDLPVVVDADALTILADNSEWARGRRAPTLLTPHAGEFARLAGAEVGLDRIGATRALARDWGVTVLLKGRATIVAAADGSTFVSDAGGAAASTAGSGDVLSGILGALLASGVDPCAAGALGARVHALAAALAAHGTAYPGGADTAAPISAGPLRDHIPSAIRALRALGASAHPEASNRGTEWHYRTL